MLMAAFVMLASAQAFAGSKYVCNEQGGKKTIVLTGENESLKEGEKYSYTLELFEKSEVMSDLRVEGTVETEDVMFSFTSNDGKVSFMIFMDEMDQSHLTLNGKDAGQFTCF
jgi:hypothetical protein